ncbi:MAG: 2-succinyl-5-enolpyruvyl-6-hydroxy-3-cyclohexene-1-carboxylic-acid synthase [Verrucomicrobiota bacterium]|nr:2-succinyl-5-enolpyruvyl-6-hydroxy-3-cyclohexene-1-carboxylic-acid synthase [Verrucomicrobiota bacterium]
MSDQGDAAFLIDQLIAQGVTLFCIAPGARSASLTSFLARDSRTETIVHYDERGLAFYALGYGKGAKTPAVIVTTSGSAVGNLLPAVMEAYHSCTPLILITADRPPESRSCGANQTTDHLPLLSSFVRWQADLPPTLSSSYFRSIAAQAFSHATQNPPGPVHLNVQIRDPSLPLTSCPRGDPVSLLSSEIVAPSTHTAQKKGLIVIGEIPSSPLPILDLAKRLRWPVCADLLSNARVYPTEEQLRHPDEIIAAEPHLKPDFLLHFGTRRILKESLPWPIDLHVSPYPFLIDPSRTVKGRACSNIASFCQDFSAPAADPAWLAAWKKADAKCAPPLASRLVEEKKAMDLLAQIAPPDTLFFFGNSLAIRLADLSFFPKSPFGFAANRGLSGIDGNIATAAGLAKGAKKRLIAWIGDQTALHDLNSLPLLHTVKGPITLVICNNFKGAIYSALPLPFAHWRETKTHIEAPHCWTFEQAATMFHLPYSSFDAISFSNSSLVEFIPENLNTERNF